MAVPLKKAEKDDFDPSELLAVHGKHEKDITDLNGRLAKIEGHLQTPQAVAEFFTESTRDSRKLDGVFAEMFCRFMKEHEGVDDAVTKKVEDIDRNFVRKCFKRFWVFIGTGLVFIAGTVFHQLVEWLLSVLPHK